MLFLADAFPGLAFDWTRVGDGPPGGIDAHGRTLRRVVGRPAGIAGRGEGDPGLVHVFGEFNWWVFSGETLRAGESWGVEVVKNKAEF